MLLSTPLSVDASTPNGRMALELKGSLRPETNRRPFRYVPFRNQGRNSPFGGQSLRVCRLDQDIRRRIRGCRSRVSHFKDPEPCHAMPWQAVQASSTGKVKRMLSVFDQGTSISPGPIEPACHHWCCQSALLARQTSRMMLCLDVYCCFSPPAASIQGHDPSDQQTSTPAAGRISLMQETRWPIWHLESVAGRRQGQSTFDVTS
ncbi:hypothetical protein B0J15DRAFT_242791 [Fusarium solani]|uniref:Uncharacterized protein n=1 Tax=Fusarium solani TaxID=169388 RepID=A0A9P9KLC6_FUSSL|nr:uncharacterized protein B0J15DRAFT_242791 [Fusarium solani]KAH7266263.1 hypothetical protein B0J15DRAFT_242791 [Fusarium solani]